MAIKLEENIDGSILKFFAIGLTTISIIDDSNGVIDSIPTIDIANGPIVFIPFSNSSPIENLFPSK